MLLLGYDIGSSAIKATLLDAQSGKVLANATSPKTELEITAPQPGWAEQNPATWWEHVKKATAEIKSKAKKAEFDPGDVGAIGIAYQMHGLVIVDENQQVLRSAIIWCDSRAVQIGEKAAADIGPEKCLENLLNHPGNFTASKLKWVMENEPGLYAKVYKAMLPGDYIAMKMSGEIMTTPSGLSEGVMWDFKKHELADMVLDYYGISPELLPPVVPTFCAQAELSKTAAEELGLKAGTKISYRAGDQPNNALALNVLNPGEIAATAGTSGVVYGVGDKANYDTKSRVNVFAHVNYTNQEPRYGVLLCVNGTGILNSWLRKNVTEAMSYEQMNALAGQAPVGCESLAVLPYGNGAERTLENRDLGAIVHGLKFSTHNRAHLLRAGQEGIAFALNYGLEIMRGMQVEVKTVRAGDANMFLSGVFSEAFATVTGAVVELYNTDGAQGAARGAGLGAGVYKNYNEAMVGLKSTKVIEPTNKLSEAYKRAYENWLQCLRGASK
ncbi:MAG: carbohydrate kinase [Actinobacteria bacterium]|nr:carbohydrate kinase [Actinomycetota bacterium]